MCKRSVRGEFVLPSCLPIGCCLDEPFRKADGDEVLYLDLGGLLSPNFFPSLAQTIREKFDNPQEECTPGPPQVFRNHGKFHCCKHVVFTSLIPVSFSNASKSLLRILVKSVGDTDRESSSDIANRVKQIFLENVLGLDPQVDVEQNDPASYFQFEGVPKGKEAFEANLLDNPCMHPRCDLGSSLCKLHRLIQERFLCNLSDELRSIVRHVAFFQTHTRPAGSFRFTAMEFPRDVDLEEYLVICAESSEDAWKSLRKQIQEKFGRFSSPCVQNSEGARVLFRGLKAGCRSSSECTGNEEWLNWTSEDLLNGTKKEKLEQHDRMGRRFSIAATLTEALEQGHRTWTAKIDMFAKVRLFDDPEATLRFFEITNVLRVGWFKGSKPIQPITKEKDFLQQVETDLGKYSGEEPNAMRYVKRLWERSAFLAQRGFDLDWHVQMLEALKPLLRSWAAELSQSAAHIETLRNMVKSGWAEHACSDLSTLGRSLSRMQSRLLGAQSLQDDKFEKQAAQEGIDCIQEALKYLPKQPEVVGKEKEESIETDLHKAQLMLESCIETVIINKLGSLGFPKVAEKLGTLWQFPSDHPPIGAELALGKCDPIRAASWNVLNRHYYKHIATDTQGLNGSQITTSHEAESERRETKIVERIKEMLEKGIHILCLQECWPEFLEQLSMALDSMAQFEMYCSGQKEDKNQEVIIFHSARLNKSQVRSHAAFRESPNKVVTEIHFEVDGMEKLRVVTAHLPGTPFGRTRREFADCLTLLASGKMLPTVLLADLNFPEKAIHPLLLLDSGKCSGLDIGDVCFVPIAYPTNICQGSLLPKRIDSIAVINANHKVEGVKLRAKALPAEDVLKGLEQVVELLKSRSTKPLTPYRYQPDKVPG